jgi:hypothetical protein
VSSRHPADPSGRVGIRGAVVMLAALVSCGGGDERGVPGSTALATTTVPSPVGPSDTGVRGAADGPASTDVAVGTTEPTSVGEVCPDAREWRLDSAASLAEAPLEEFTPAVFPLRVDDGGELVDDAGRPYLVHGDAAWSMIVQLTSPEVEEYLETRAAQHFNTLIVELIESTYADDPVRNASGAIPFRRPGDFSTPDPDYFDAAHRVIEQARDHGFLVLLYPMYLGFANTGEGFSSQLEATPREVAFDYGRFVGERFADLDNVIWVHGGDDLPAPEVLELVEVVREGIIAGGARQLHTAHWSRELSASDADVEWLDINTTYTGEPVYIRSVADDEAEPLPHILIEAQYENDRFDNTPQRVRAQAYESLLTGASGSVFGNGIIWPFLPAWRDSLASVGADDMSHVRPLFESVPWFDLEPDVVDRSVVIEPGTFGEAAYTVAASTHDRSDVVVYQPVENQVTLELGCPGTVSVRWYDPTAGRFAAAAAAFGGEGSLVVEHPGPNAAGDHDWVLSVHVDR